MYQDTGIETFARLGKHIRVSYLLTQLNNNMVYLLQDMASIFSFLFDVGATGEHGEVGSQGKYSFTLDVLNVFLVLWS